MKLFQSSILLKSIAAITILGIFIPLFRTFYFGVSALDPDSNTSVLIEVHKGQSPNDLTKTLASQGIISNPKSFIWLGRLTRQWKKIKAGEYKVSPSMTPIEIFSILTSGISAAYPLTVREGENFFEIADELSAKGFTQRDHFIELCRDKSFISSLGTFQNVVPTTLEGYLFPDTYFIDRTQSEPEIIKNMVKRFFSYWTPKFEERAKELRMTRHEVITLASMIEKETGAPEERPLISSVFHNRLKKRMKLQSDPTTIYGMWERYDGKIHKKDLFEKNAYNTYTIESLPVGPIGNPGTDAIHAALYPADSPFLYFVSHNDGTHEFSKSIEDHNRAVRKYQLDPRARQGKSWRDLRKRPASVPIVK